MSERYEYTFVRRKVRGSFFSGQFDAEYQEIIRRHAADGWRFIQAYAPATAGYGAAINVDLIFERPLQ